MSAVMDKIGASLGLIASAGFLMLYSVAMSQDPEYAFFENYLSDLGVGPGAWAFNCAVILAGALIILFAVFGMRPVLGAGLGSALGTALLATSGVLLMCVGVFTEDAGDIHYYVSVSFFLCLLLSTGAYTNTLYRTRALGWFGVVISLATFIFGAALISQGGSPQSETLAVLAAIVWGTLMSAACLLKQAGKPIP